MAERVELVWRKSTKSGSANCLEIAVDGEGRVLLRDSKDPEGPTLAFEREIFQQFVAGLKAGNPA